MRKLLFLLLAAAVVPSCAPSETIRTGSTVPQAAAARQGTYTLIPFDETIAVGVFNEALLEGLEDALAAALEAKGYSRVSEDPDILVAVYVTREGKFQSHDWGYRHGWRKPEWDAYWVGRRAAAREMEEGTVVLDIIDAKKKEHVWGGSAPGVLLPGPEGVVENKAAEEALAKILADYP
jgi:hypothetical protein